jgi:AcrR family transcriptional regulator
MVAQEEQTAVFVTRERLLRTAFQLFHEQGYHATGVATILREAGVNAGSLYHFFSSKDDLLLKVLEFALDYLEPMVMGPAEAATVDPLERVFALLNLYRERAGANQCRMGCPIGNLALEVSDGNPQARADSPQLRELGRPRRGLVEQRRGRVAAGHRSAPARALRAEGHGRRLDAGARGGPHRPVRRFRRRAA